MRPRSGRSPGSAVVIDEGNASENTSIMSQLDLSPSAGSLQAKAEQRLRALIDIGQTLAKAESLEDVFPRVLDSLFRIFPQADRGFIVTKGPAGELVPRWTKTRKESNETMRISLQIVTKVMESKQAWLSGDATSDQQLASDSVARLQIRSFLCAPLLDAEGEPIGVLQVDSLDPTRKFGEEDLEVLATVALQAGITIGTVKMQEAALRQRELDRDLELAHEVQHGFLPFDRPQIPTWQFADYYVPANHVGGDLYDYVALPDGRMAVVVADVVGHGIAAALLMAKISSEARFSLATEPDLASAARRMNYSLFQLHLDRFVTMVIGLIDPRTRQVSVVNAGHMTPIRRLENGRIEQPGHDCSGLPLGIVDDFAYEEYTIQLEEGDELIFMTDGIFEASNDRDEQLGLDRVRSVIAMEGGRSAGETCDSLVRLVKQHMGHLPPDDDMCVVVVDCRKESGTSAGEKPTQP
ncbi:MAG: GAF domain-containing SpoIIE family protein phosphatase [Pirellulaceae bacterium]